MKVFDIIGRLQLMHKLISERKTGTPEEFAKRLGIGRSTLYDLIDDLKSRDVPITYCRRDKSYEYSRPVSIEISFRVRPLSNQELKEKNGGSKFFSKSGNSGLYRPILVM